MNKQVPFWGSATALITPFDECGGLDMEALDELIEFQLSEGTDALVVCGTTGECATLSDDEKQLLFERAVRSVGGRSPVIAGTGSNDTAHCAALSKRAQRAGADALLIVTPYYNKTSQRGLVEHYRAIADSVELPIILYNVPSRTGMTISPEACAALGEHERIVAIKEASSDISHVAELLAHCGDSLHVYSGNDDQTLPMLSLGAKGVISVLANIMPRASGELCRLWRDGRTREAAQLALSLTRINKALFCDVNPIPVKTALRMMGYHTGGFRRPLCELLPGAAESLRETLEAYGLLGADAAFLPKKRSFSAT